ncbi:MAG: recombination regulator RecX [Aquabacterium sp.]|uniref:recombination regulator RecX n=1 Tax=Aquabacterium sp. TaxID=1872578 RepID=UPI002716E821|nr:recombination regulator RecX [Aquabacterium sp.]MDO9006547.1 recombination regulator RecX [Aquabacterium sp.]
MATRGSTLSLKGRALKYLSAREHSRVELVRKLKPHAEDPSEIDRVLDDLESRGWLSAERFVESVVHRKAARYGAARIRLELNGHQLPDEAVRSALSGLKDTELQRAQALWLRRYGQVAETPQERAKQMRFLAGRGFSGDVIRQVVRGSSDTEDPNEA